MEYSSLLVTEKDYSADSILGLTVIYTLNAEGYAIQSVSTGGKKKSLDFRSVFSMLFGNQSPSSATNTYEYDADGYLTKIVLNSGTSTSETITFTVVNGNRVGTSYLTGGFTYTGTSQYLMDKINTIGYENMGITFMGKQEKNLVQTAAISMSGVSLTQTYTYQYDSQNRVTNSIVTTPGQNAISTSYAYK